MSVRLASLIKNNISISKKHIIIPVPLHFWRKITRGFNQSDIIAKKVGELLDIGYNNNVVSKRKHTRQQSKLSQEKRIDNLSDAFKIDKKHIDKIDNKIVLLVDDVISSGTTLNEIAKILKKNGAKKVIAVCLASD
ncbi:hypothetical protein LR004_01340 [Candidatus Gracilibacteria bacterium]|nr:hypothetical protein [Candidatus Gracilibacteria bacterium]